MDDLVVDQCYLVLEGFITSSFEGLPFPPGQAQIYPLDIQRQQRPNSPLCTFHYLPTYLKAHKTLAMFYENFNFYKWEFLTTLFLRSFSLLQAFLLPMTHLLSATSLLPALLDKTFATTLVDAAVCPFIEMWRLALFFWRIFSLLASDCSQQIACDIPGLAPCRGPDGTCTCCRT